ncbi:threonine/serine ThrE exporter family protein [Actinomyces bowdenii]|uniref:Threonine/serine exporter family protein n=1 Tax=Actinomyces bowdenii TaxID=131109 RepID=A0A3P1V811_9ACTO|nr:threonine/serine exporter family protein [Actinomyces bowdenii]RRD29796.1 threonine/serine exporter family protein [Actinomyces bowdenii]
MLRSGVVLRLGRLMLAAGAGSYRVKSSMARAAAALGIDRHEATVTMTEIVTSSYAGQRFRTETAEIRRGGVNVARLERLRRIVHDLREHESAEHLNAKLDEVETMHGLYPAPINALASGVACAGFCFLNAGGWPECLCVLIAAAAGQYLRRSLLLRHYQHFLTWLLCGLASSALYMGLIALLRLSGLAPGNHQGGIISAILFLIPGFPMVTAMLDLVRQDFSSALSRFAYVVMVMTSAGVAVWSVTHAFHWHIEATSTVAPTGALLYSLRLLCSFVAAYGFAILFNAPARACLLSAIIGALANTGRLLLIDELGIPWQLAVGLAATVIGLMAQLFVARASHSRVALSVPAVVIMIPGVPFYRAVSALNEHGSDPTVAIDTAMENLVEVFFVITAIGVGLALARILTDRNWRHDVPTSALPGHRRPQARGTAAETAPGR